MDILEQFKQRVEDAITRNGLTPSQFGFDAVGDPSFVFAIRGSRVPKLTTMAKVDRYIAKIDADRLAKKSVAAKGQAA